MEEMRARLEKAFKKPVEITEVMKNGIPVKGFMIDMSDDLKPVVYPDMVDVNNLDRLVDVINSEFDKRKEMFNGLKNLTKNEAIGMMRLCARRKTDDDTPKKIIGDIELYVRLVNDDYSTVMTREMLEHLEMFDGEAFDYAQKNTNYKIFDISDVIPFAKKEFMLILTTDDRRYGASSIASLEILDEACDRFGEDSIIILPSSIHELIAVKQSDTDDTNGLIDLISTVNETSLEETEVLGGNPYLYNKNTKKIEILSKTY